MRGRSGLGGGSGFGEFCSLGVLTGAVVTPPNLVALGSGAHLADLALVRGLESTTATHLLEDTLSIKLGLQAFQGTVYRFAFLDVDSTDVLVAHS